MPSYDPSKHTAFTYLRPGDRFRFVYGAFADTRTVSPSVFTKGRNGWFRADDGRNYRTGKFTAVQFVASDEVVPATPRSGKGH